MKKYLPFFATTITVFLLAACALTVNEKPEAALRGSWRIDSVSLADSSDRKAALSLFLFAFSQKMDTAGTTLHFSADSVWLRDGSGLQRFAYT